MMPEKLFYQEWDFWVSAFTLLLVLVTAKLAWETKKLREDSAKSIAASESTAKASAESAAIAQTAMQRTLRAYVTIDRIEPRVRTEDDNPREVDISVINTGQTPARNLTVNYCAWVFSREHLPKSASEVSNKFRTWMPSNLGKDQRRTVHGHFLPHDNVLANPGLIPVVCGEAHYCDMLSDEPRVTEFCYVWDHNLKGFDPAAHMNTIT